MKDLLLRLTSRTFWVCIGTVIMLVSNEQYTEAASVAVAYILGEKTVDTFKSNKLMPYDAEIAGSQNVNPDEVVSGTGTIKRRDEALVAGDKE